MKLAVRKFRGVTTYVAELAVSSDHTVCSKSYPKFHLELYV
jgi:hypothetical protein